MDSSKSMFRVFSCVVALVLMIGMLQPMVAVPVQASTTDAQKAVTTSQNTPSDPLQKLHPTLREAAKKATPASVSGVAPAQAEQSIFVEVFFKGTDAQLDAVKKLFVDSNALVRPFNITAGDKTKTQDQHLVIGSMLPSRLTKLASNDQVLTALPVTLNASGSPVDRPLDDTEKKAPPDRATLKANADLWRANAKPVTSVNKITPQDWYEVDPSGPTHAQSAWDRGFNGSGVTVTVDDDGIDFAHPDLMGTQKIVTDASSPYKGWPMAFSPFSMLLYALNPAYARYGSYPGMDYADTRTVPTLADCETPSATCKTFTYTPWDDFQVPGTATTFTVDPTLSKSGNFHVGTHPDYTLRDYVYGERPAVLVADPHTAGVYDTVIVDLNDDYDFRNDAQLSKADVANPSTYNRMIAALDVSTPSDGIADVSGGMLYFIGDGVTPLPASDYLYGAGGLIPSNGNLVAFSGGNFLPYESDGGYSHGTQCASNIVGQGVIDGYVPTYLTGTPSAPGSSYTPSAAVKGIAPGAKMVSVTNVYLNFDSSVIDAFIFNSAGYDGIDQTGYNMKTSYQGAPEDDTDAIQVTSNSFGNSDVDNDGWDLSSQFMEVIQKGYAPQQQYALSTGNGGPGFGTVTPPSPSSGIKVGASTEMGSTGWDSLKYISQINFNDVTPFSDRGPGARDGSGTDVVAGGAYAAGDYKLNSSSWGLDGNYAWDTWGGTSRAAPVAAGVMALLDQAYKSDKGAFPQYDVARNLIMSTASDLSNNVYTQGSGGANADRGTLVASGEYGIMPSLASWSVGTHAYGPTYTSSNLAQRGQTYTQNITLTNPSDYPITTGVTSGSPTKVSSVQFTWTMTPAMVAAISPANGLKVPQFILPLFSKKAGASSWWTKYLPSGVPAGTDLMTVRAYFPYSTFDPTGTYTAAFKDRLAVYNWSDDNGDGKILTNEATDTTGQVTYALTSGTGPFIDGLKDVDWANVTTPPTIERYEYSRFAYNNPYNNTQEVTVQNPLTRTIDGAFVGIYMSGTPAITQNVAIQFQVDFYKYQPVSWLDVYDASGIKPISSVRVPANGSVTLQAKATVPSDMPFGSYDAAIKLVDPGLAANLPTHPAYPAHTSAIPVIMNVAASYTGSANVTFGGTDTQAADADRQYNNGSVKGYFDWSWREESGDTRFFYANVAVPQADGKTKLMVNTTWTDANPTDIDTSILGPSKNSISTLFGTISQNTLGILGRSADVRSGRAIWNFDTSTGGASDWVSMASNAAEVGANYLNGPYEVIAHNVLYAGDKNEVPFSSTLGKVVTNTDAIAITTGSNSGKAATITFQSSFDHGSAGHPGLVAKAFGLGGPQTSTVALPLSGYTQTFTVANAGLIDIRTSSSDVSDVDLYLYYCGPTPGTTCQQIASSATSSANEHVQVILPADGDYEMFVDNYSGPAGHLTYTLNLAMGTDLSVSSLPTGAIGAGTTVNFDIRYNKSGMVGGKTYQGLLVYGPAEAPGMFLVPISITRLYNTFMPFTSK